ncbi:MAG: hypothetical protein ACRC2T_20235 [Thermoguttaceae bacterium]
MDRYPRLRMLGISNTGVQRFTQQAAAKGLCDSFRTLLLLEWNQNAALDQWIKNTASEHKIEVDYYDAWLDRNAAMATTVPLLPEEAVISVQMVPAQSKMEDETPKSAKK